jgi:hypothetical protein
VLGENVVDEHDAGVLVEDHRHVLEENENVDVHDLESDRLHDLNGRCHCQNDVANDDKDHLSSAVSQATYCIAEFLKTSENRTEKMSKRTSKFTRLRAIRLMAYFADFKILVS